MSINKISIGDIQNMVSHWLTTISNGYLGSSYGQNANDLLQNPLSFSADDFIIKLKNDLPILNSLPSDSVNIYKVDNGIDKATIYLNVSGKDFTLKGDYFAN